MKNLMLALVFSFSFAAVAHDGDRRSSVQPHRPHDPRIVIGCVSKQHGCDVLAARYNCHYGIAKVTDRCPRPGDNGYLTCIGVHCH